MPLDVDEILEKVGPLGKFQIRTVIVIGWIGFCMALFLLAPTFLAGEPAWRCVTNSSACNMTGEFSLGVEGYDKRCSMERSDWEFLDTFTSVTTEWELVCDRAILMSVTSSVYFAGYLIGVIGLGYISDRFGRKKIGYFSAVACAVVSLTVSFSPNLNYFNFCRFIMGFFGGGSSMVAFLICMEVSGVKHRGTAGTAMWVFVLLGMMVTSPLAYLLRDWRDFSLCLGIISLTIIPLWWWVPETPRWLVTNGHIKEAEELFKKIADINGTQYPGEQIKVNEKETQRRANFFDLFRKKKSTFSILIQWFGWAVNALVYYSVSLGTQNIGGNIYLTYFLLCLVEIPGTFATMWVIIKFGRKVSVIGSLWAAAIASICAALFPIDGGTGLLAGRIIMALIAKFMVTISFDGIYVWSGELFPTTVRNSAMGSCSSIGRLGSFSASFVNYLTRVHAMLPFGVMAIASIAAGALCFFLPETRGRSTPENIEEDDTFHGLSEENNNFKEDNNGHEDSDKGKLANMYTTQVLNI